MQHPGTFIPKEYINHPTAKPGDPMPDILHIDNPAFKYVFIIVGVIMFFIFIDIMCCMSGNKKKYLPYYLEQTNNQKALQNKKEEFKLKKQNTIEKKRLSIKK